MSQEAHEVLAALSSDEVRGLKDRIVRKILRRGRACAPDLANEITATGSSTTLLTADELLVILNELVQEGVLRLVADPGDEREYKPPYQTVYEVAL